MTSARLYILQRLSALIMAPLVIGHIAVMIFAVNNGLSADEILGRTQNSLLWAAFYSLFVVCVAVHGAIGVRVISFEWFGLRGWGLDAVSWAVFFSLAGLGFQAVFSVTGGA